jgi:hypothetical protein
MTQWGFPTDELREEHTIGLPRGFEQFAAVVGD